MLQNQETIRKIGLEAFLAAQAERTAFLRDALSRHNDGRSKGFYCIAVALLSTENLQEALRRADSGENLRAVLNEYATAEGQELKLQKDGGTRNG
jgi:hypothetical protein